MSRYRRSDIDAALTIHTDVEKTRRTLRGLQESDEIYDKQNIGILAC